MPLSKASLPAAPTVQKKHTAGSSFLENVKSSNNKIKFRSLPAQLSVQTSQQPTTKMAQEPSDKKKRVETQKTQTPVTGHRQDAAKEGQSTSKTSEGVKVSKVIVDTDNKKTQAKAVEPVKETQKEATDEQKAPGKKQIVKSDADDHKLRSELEASPLHQENVQDSRSITDDNEPSDSEKTSSIASGTSTDMASPSSGGSKQRESNNKYRGRPRPGDKGVAMKVTKFKRKPKDEKMKSGYKSKANVDKSNDGGEVRLSSESMSGFPRKQPVKRASEPLPAKKAAATSSNPLKDLLLEISSGGSTPRKEHARSSPDSTASAKRKRHIDDDGRPLIKKTVVGSGDRLISRPRVRRPMPAIDADVMDVNYICASPGPQLLRRPRMTTETANNPYLRHP
ncbi:hypothetical protein P153DRAFT_184239 [Dothidotthia symphoricarpi CBS 119687]|uniref:Uncharacterized protein n=1 Tax=Dothidotthia symphoricarpi CBS 119687 TaxID=1392245 RepID=A0A6A6AMI9_9PLEO|nr:uncharacterized protein P153DRAFT_184239 [Dothidotthia symphoricarpi CBS 119687]KAF2132097.1 hypothetical protein P153DRAFT_184239 [Dothidotthia symphoricarpi CBS 119687]